MKRIMTLCGELNRYAVKFSEEHRDDYNNE